MYLTWVMVTRPKFVTNGQETQRHRTLILTPAVAAPLGIVLYTAVAVVPLLLRQGEPGVGKTLLVEECGREWQREGVQVGIFLRL